MIKVVLFIPLFNTAFASNQVNCTRTNRPETNCAQTLGLELVRDQFTAVRCCGPFLRIVPRQHLLLKSPSTAIKELLQKIKDCKFPTTNGCSQWRQKKGTMKNNTENLHLVCRFQYQDQTTWSPHHHQIYLRLESVLKPNASESSFSAFPNTVSLKLPN